MTLSSQGISSTLTRILIGSLLLLTLSAAHDPHSWHDEDHSYDKARRAVELGKALPIDQVIAHLRSHYSGDIVAVEYEHEFDQWVYEFKVIDKQGRLRRIHLNAGTGELVNEQD